MDQARRGSPHGSQIVSPAYTPNKAISVSPEVALGEFTAHGAAPVAHNLVLRLQKKRLQRQFGVRPPIEPASPLFDDAELYVVVQYRIVRPRAIESSK